jgi:hypothetical protein
MREVSLIVRWQLVRQVSDVEDLIRELRGEARSSRDLGNHCPHRGHGGSDQQRRGRPVGGAVEADASGLKTALV